jgi:DNA-binding NarL/FixJ family response regulator
MRVLIVEDEPLLRSTLAQLLQAEPDVEVVASVADGEDAVRMGLSLKPDAVLMDLQLPSLSGIEATRQLYANGYGGAVVVLTQLKDASAAQVVGSLRAAARGEGVIYPTLAPRVLAEFRRLSDRPDAQRELYQMLSRREVEVLEKIAEGKRNREIADELVLSERTVKNHVGAILKKLQVNDRAEAAEVATRHGLAGE